MTELKVVSGIEITENLMRVAEVEHRGDNYFLSRVIEKEINPSNVDSMVDALTEIINEAGFFSNIASIAIDTNFAEIDTIPIDGSLSAQELQDLLLAEIRLHRDSPADDYRVAFEPVLPDSNSFQKVFYAGLQSQLIKNIRDAFIKCGINVRYIDLDHFCSELYLARLVKISGEGPIELVSVKSGRVEATLLDQGRRLGYRYSLYSGESFYFINKVVHDLEKDLNIDIERVFVTGSEADLFLINLLNKSTDRKVFQLLTPGEKLLRSPLVEKSSAYLNRPHTYSSAIGAALK
ncbi:MAG: hypothetical protein ACP5US_02000 [Candidatus Kryptoniota bacterium]